MLRAPPGPETRSWPTIRFPPGSPPGANGGGCSQGSLPRGCHDREWGASNAPNHPWHVVPFAAPRSPRSVRIEHHPQAGPLSTPGRLAALRDAGGERPSRSTAARTRSRARRSTSWTPLGRRSSNSLHRAAAPAHQLILEVVETAGAGGGTGGSEVTSMGRGEYLRLVMTAL